MGHCRVVEFEERIDWLLTSAVFAFTVAAAIAGVHFIARLGLSEFHTTPILKSLSVSAFLLFAAPVGYQAASLMKSANSPSSAFFQLTAIGILVLIGFFAEIIGPNSGVVIYASGTGFLFWGFIHWLKKGPVLASIAFLAVTLAFGSWVAATVFGSGYQDPLFIERILIGEGKTDTLMHCAVSSMLQTYGVPSTGLDGLPYIPYHFGSHWLLAKLSSLMNVSILDSYHIGFPIIVLPLFLNSILLFAAEIKGLLPKLRNDHRYLRSNTIFWALLFMAHLGVVPLAYSNWNSQLVSESYSCGLILAFNFVSLGLGSFMGILHSPSNKCDAQWFLLVLMVSIAIPLVGICKISLMYLLVGLGSYFCFRLGIYKKFLGILLLVTLVISFLVTFKLVFSVGTQPSGAHISLCHFLRGYVRPEWWPFFYLSEFFWSWLFIAMKLFQQRIMHLSQLGEAIASRKILDIEAVVVVCVLGAAPGMFLAIDGGGAYYFSDFQRWFSLGLILANLENFTIMVTQLWSEKVRGIPNIKVSRASRFTIVGIVIICCICPGINFERSYYDFFAWQAKIRKELYGATGSSGFARFSLLRTSMVSGNFLMARDALLWGSVVKHSDLTGLKSYKILSILQELSRLSPEEKRKTVVYIPQKFESFWTMYPDCRSAPFLVPGITGIAMLEGVPQSKCELSHWGYEIYASAIRTNHSQELERIDLCFRAKQKGFSQLVEVDENTSPETLMSRACIGHNP
jgi:hypothetical protein